MAGHEGNGMPQIGSMNKKGQIITDPQELFFFPRVPRHF